MEAQDLVVRKEPMGEAGHIREARRSDDRLQRVHRSAIGDKPVGLIALPNGKCTSSQARRHQVVGDASDEPDPGHPAQSSSPLRRARVEVARGRLGREHPRRRRSDEGLEERRWHPVGESQVAGSRRHRQPRRHKGRRSGSGGEVVVEPMEQGGLIKTARAGSSSSAEVVQKFP